MDKKLKKYIQQLIDKIKSLDKKKKIIMTCCAAAVIIVIIMVVTALNTTKYELLCDGLTESEAGQVYSAVEEQGVPVKVRGTSIYVQQGKADIVRMQLAEAGLPQGNLAYDIYSSGTNYAETDKDKEIKQLQQIQNRLQDTIETIPGVTQAIVNIAKSNDDTYVLESDKTPTTASVKLTLKKGTALTKTQVNGIVQLVANSVSGLSPENVTVNDSDGTVLNGTPNSTDETAEQLSMKTKYENQVKDKLIQMLGQIYGNDNVNVVVNADFDFSKVSTVTNSYTSGVPNVTTNENEVYMAGSSLAAGAAGVSGAQPAYPSTSSLPLSTYSSKTTTTTSMLVGSIQQQIQSNGGQLKNLTVAVLLNGYNAAAAETDTNMLKQTVAAAAGTTPDKVSVGQMGFSSAMPAVSASSYAPSTLPIRPGKAFYIIVAAVLLLIVLLTLLLVLLRQRRKKREKAIQEQLAAEQAEQEQKELEVKTKAPPIKSIEETREENEDNTYKKQIEDFADKKPELVAQILKNWLKD
jgi:flagellar M-ring protein FliF